MTPSGVADRSRPADVFSDQPVVYYRSEGEADGVLQVQTVLTHPPIKIIKLSSNSPHRCLFLNIILFVYEPHLTLMS